ncbi:MAG TPA: MFS transporter, partial [Paraburkholderia sp.]|nr:MFS transporter [Paraburkholderia sp.]
AFSWLPVMLSSAGLPLALAGSGLTAYNLGGVFGALGCALAIARFGSRWPMLICCAGAALSAFAMHGVDATRTPALLIIGFGVHGLFVNAVQSTMYALCAFVYPTRVRATGTSSALAFGRLGAVLSAFAGAAVISAGGASAYLSLLAIAMLLVFVALAMVRNHIARPGNPRRFREAKAGSISG